MLHLLPIFNLALRRWCRQLLGWPRASPIAAIHWEVGIGDSLRLVLGRAFPLFGRLCASDPAGSRSPLPATIFRLCANVRGTWAHWCASALRSLSVPLSCEFGISACSPPMAVARWCSREVRVRLDRDFHHRLAAMQLTFMESGWTLQQTFVFQSTPATSRSLGLGFGDSLVGATTPLLQVGPRVTRIAEWVVVCAMPTTALSSTTSQRARATSTLET